MQRFLFFTAWCLMGFGCSQTEKAGPSSTDSNKKTSPIDGNWELVETVENGKKVTPVVQQQLKIFNDGFFCFTHLNPDGSFHGSGGGPFTVEGNTYKETFRYYNDTTWVGYADQQTWELRGDTLIFEGFKKVFDRSGKELPATAWGGDKFVEKRVRVK